MEASVCINSSCTLKGRNTLSGTFFLHLLQLQRLNWLMNKTHIRVNVISGAGGRCSLAGLDQTTQESHSACICNQITAVIALSRGSAARVGAQEFTGMGGAKNNFKRTREVYLTARSESQPFSSQEGGELGVFVLRQTFPSKTKVRGRGGKADPSADGLVRLASLSLLRLFLHSSRVCSAFTLSHFKRFIHHWCF